MSSLDDPAIWAAQKKEYIVTVGYAPIPERCLSPKKWDPISSPAKLQKYINAHEHGCFKEADFDTAEQALEWLRGVELPRGVLWFKRVMQQMGEGVPNKEVSYTSGIKNKLEHIAR